jgi:hypothetical protein
MAGYWALRNRPALPTWRIRKLFHPLDWFPGCVCVYLPGADASGLVAPIMDRPYLITSFPSHTMATTGPEDRKLTSFGKKGLPGVGKRYQRKTEQSRHVGRDGR